MEEELIICINTRICLIQTGDPYMNADDARMVSRENKIKELSGPQKQLLLDLGEIKEKLYQIIFNGY
jgi:hypothetical protein